MKNVIELTHPLIQHHLVRLRDEQTPPPAFRRIVHRLTALLTYEATQDLQLTPVEVQTPLAKASGRQLTHRIGLVPILRAGLGMVDPVLELIPHAEVWHLGFYRDEKTLEPVEYYRKLPSDYVVDTALVLDPMLATGGSALAAFSALKDWGVSNVKLLSLIAAPEGLEAVRAKHPNIRVYVCAIDSHLDEKAYIVPGLGDAGDRMFNARAD